MEYYSAMRKEDILPFMTTWIYLEHIMLREISQKERQVLYGTTCLWKLKKLHLLKTESKMVVTRAWREGACLQLVRQWLLCDAVFRCLYETAYYKL